MSDLHTWGVVAVIALVTGVTRFLPFVIWSGNRKTPALIEKLGKSLPYAVMGMLVVYCLKSVSFTEVSGFLPELISCVVAGILYVWKRNTLISIIFGTACYMLLVQKVF